MQDIEPIPVNVRAVMIQHGLLEEYDVVYTLVGRKVICVPVWLAFQMEVKGGIRQLIRDYGLTKYRFPGYEETVLQNIEDEAEALWRYWRRHGNQHYYDLLGDVDRALLDAERYISMTIPHAKGRYKYELIAQKMGKGWGWRQAKEWLDEVTTALRKDHVLRKAKKYITLARLVKEAQSENEFSQAA